jgi:hypothetical protein
MKLASGKASVASMLSNQKGVTYTYGNCADRETYSESTGVEETDKNVFLHSPRLGMFAFTEVLPFPSISLPAELVTSAESELHVAKSSFKPAENKTIKQLLERTGTDTLSVGKNKYPCYLLEGKNTNYIAELGQYHCKYWFNEQLGFIRLYYTKPDGSAVDIYLESTNFE